MTGEPELDHEELRRLARRRRSRAVRGAVLVAVVVVAVVFVVQNSQPVRLHFWFLHGRPRLIWVVLVSLVVGIVFGFLLGTPGRKAARRRRRQEKQAAQEERRAARGR